MQVKLKVTLFLPDLILGVIIPVALHSNLYLWSSALGIPWKEVNPNKMMIGLTIEWEGLDITGVVLTSSFIGGVGAPDSCLIWTRLQGRPGTHPRDYASHLEWLPQEEQSEPATTPVNMLQLRSRKLKLDDNWFLWPYAGSGVIIKPLITTLHIE